MQALRFIDFISRVVLKKHHRALIPHFKKYQVVAIPADDDDQISAATIKVIPQAIIPIDPTQDYAKLMADLMDTASFNPEKDPIDAGVLYEATGFRAAPEKVDFWNDFFDYERINACKKTNELISAVDTNRELHTNAIVPEELIKSAEHHSATSTTGIVNYEASK